MTEDRKRAVVLELLAQDAQTGLDSAVAERRQELVNFIEGLWDKYRVTMADLRNARLLAEEEAKRFIATLGYQ